MTKFSRSTIALFFAFTVLLGLAIVLWTGSMTGSTVGRTQANRAPSTDNARSACANYSSSQGLNLELLTWSGATAADVVNLAEEFGIDTSPWSEVPGDHGVALCTFGSDYVNGTTSTSVCSGDTISVLSESQVKVIVDGAGRVSPNFLDTQLPSPFPPCQ
jgi:hypothetical protein